MMVNKNIRWDLICKMLSILYDCEQGHPVGLIIRTILLNASLTSQYNQNRFTFYLPILNNKLCDKYDISSEYKINIV